MLEAYLPWQPESFRPNRMAALTPTQVAQLEHILGKGRVCCHPVDRIAFSRDASLYQVVPSAVVRPGSSQSIIGLLHWCRMNGIPITFRTAGTSLSGQAVGAGLLVDLSRDWTGVTVGEDAMHVSCQPGITGGAVNARLAPSGRKIGPDPASLNACMIGGIVANNSSGMCCGTRDNAYQTLKDIVFILPDGERYDTSNPDHSSEFFRRSPRIAHCLQHLHKHIQGNPDLTAAIRHKYRIKNTMGYSLNSFLDEEDPLRIMARLLVGSEGTLGFIEQVTLKTVSDPRYKTTALIFFSDIEAAGAFVPEMIQLDAACVELMDSAAMRSVAHLPDTPEQLRHITPDSCALLVELQAESEAELQDKLLAAQGTLAMRLPGIRVDFTSDTNQRNALWRVRKMLISTIGAMRPRGFTMVNEDVAVEPRDLSALVSGLQGLFRRHRYDEAIIFGHARDGNMHFIVNVDMEKRDEVQKYHSLMQDVTELVAIQFSGSLKAEHGTGRNMAPFVPLEWGQEAYEVMKEIKSAVDPNNVMNPGVLITDDAEAHLKNIKRMKQIDSNLDACIECGFCEHVCPSSKATISPRQRIILQREEVYLNNLISTERAEKSRLSYMATDTCVTDSMCFVMCPVGVDTGAFVKSVRGRFRSQLSKKIAALLARRYSIVNFMGKTAANIAMATSKFVGESFLKRVTSSMRWTGLPTYNAKLGLPGHLPKSDSVATYYYLPSCPSRWTGNTGMGDITNTWGRLIQRASAGWSVVPNAAGKCCGQIFESKGYSQAAQSAADSIADDLPDGAVIFTDASTCSHRLLQVVQQNQDRVTVISVVDAMGVLLDNIPVKHKVRSVVLHPGCAVHLSGEVEKLRLLLTRLSHEVYIPHHSACCGAAGDKGILYPEVASAAVAQLKDEINGLKPDGFYSLNSICEASLTEHTGKTFSDLIMLIDQVTR